MKKLYRSRKDSKLFGLCGGLAELLNVDSTLLRVVFLVTAFFTEGTLIPIYFIACLVIPKEPAFEPFYDPAYGYSSGARSTGRSPAYPRPKQESPLASSPEPQPNIDEMMRDVEKKALQKEIEQLRAKLSQLEKGDKEL